MKRIWATIKNRSTDIFTITIALFVSFIVVKFSGLATDQLLSGTFMLTYLGLFIGFQITIATFDISIMFKIIDAYLSLENRDGVEDPTKKCIRTNSELKENLLLMFIFFVLIAFLKATIHYNFPVIHGIGWFSKEVIYNTISLSVFLLSLYIMYDLIIATFILSGYGWTRRHENDGAN